MIKNYFKFLMRVLNKNKTHTIINITGLSIGISTCLVIFLLVHHELSFDKHIPERNKIYRIYTRFTGAFSGANRGIAMGPQQFFHDNFKHLADIVEIHTFERSVKLNIGEKEEPIKLERGIAFVDSNFFSLFPKKWLAGTITGLETPYKAILSKDAATKLFGDLEPDGYLNKEFVVRDSILFTVSGIIADDNENSDFDLHALLSLPSLSQKEFSENFNKQDDWSNTSSSEILMVKLHPKTTYEQLKEMVEATNKKYVEINKEKSWNVNYSIQSFDDIHYNAELGIFDHKRETAHKPSLYILSGIAFLILLLAAINFINLETAQSVKRAKEIGIRKALGSTRVQLMIQFVFQSILITSLAAIIAIPLAELSLIVFKDFLPSGLQINLLQPEIWLIIIALVVIIGIISSTYPALIISNYKPAIALRNISTIDNKSSRTHFLRKVLITFQFSFSQILIIGTIVLVAQLHFMLNKDMGFNSASVIHLSAPYQESKLKLQSFKSEVEKLSAVEKISLNSAPPAENGYSSSVLTYVGNTQEEIEVNAFRKFGDENYLSIYDIELVAGRYASASDSLTEIVINEKLANEFGFQAQDAVGKFVKQSNREIPIVGVVKDFHISSLKQDVLPVYMANDNSSFGDASIKINYNKDPEQLENSISEIRKAWQKIYADYSFNYQFVDETIRNFYEKERKMTKLAGGAMTLSIIISCLGLYGLISLSAVQRTKEIGIRKTLGASVRQIVMLLANDFLLLVFVSFVLAIPVALYIVQYILEDFAFKIDTPWYAFILTLVVSILLAFLTVSIQAVKAARVNPVDSLKSE